MTARLLQLRVALAEALATASPALQPHILALARQVAGQLARPGERPR